jgi:hypothetical protein
VGGADPGVAAGLVVAVRAAAGDCAGEDDCAGEGERGERDDAMSSPAVSSGLR